MELECALRKLLSNESIIKEMGQEAAKIQETLNPKRINLLWKDYFDFIMT